MKSIVYKECCPSEPRQRHITAASQARAIRVVGTPITCKVCQNTRPRSQFRPDASEQYRISKGLTCEPSRAEGKLNKGSRKRLSEVTRSGTTGLDFVFRQSPDMAKPKESKGKPKAEAKAKAKTKAEPKAKTSRGRAKTTNSKVHTVPEEADA